MKCKIQKRNLHSIIYTYYIIPHFPEKYKKKADILCIFLQNIYLSMREEVESGEIKNQNVEIEVLQT